MDGFAHVLHVIVGCHGMIWNGIINEANQSLHSMRAYAMITSEWLGLGHIVEVLSNLRCRDWVGSVLTRHSVLGFMFPDFRTQHDLAPCRGRIMDKDLFCTRLSVMG